MLYEFKTGDEVKLKELDYYTFYKVPPWSSLKILEAKGNSFLLTTKEGTSFWCEYEKLSLPLGFQEEYSICVTEKTEAAVREWMKSRGGIAVWVSHDLSTPGRYMYTPGDRSNDKPHWSMGLVEVVTNPKRIKLMREEVRHDKPSPKEWTLWKYDKRNRLWWRHVELPPMG